MVPEEINPLAHTLRALSRLDPLAEHGRSPDRADETPHAAFAVGAVVATHDGLNGVGGFVGIVPGHAVEEVVDDVGFDDSVHEVAADEAEVTVDGCGGAAGEVPGCGVVVGEGGIGVLEERDPDWMIVLAGVLERGWEDVCSPSQLLTQRYGAP